MKSIAGLNGGARASHSGTVVAGIGTAPTRRTAEPPVLPGKRAAGGIRADEQCTSGLAFRCARTSAELEALAAAWRALEARSATPVFFQSFAWCDHVLRTLRRWPDCDPVQPLVLSAWRGEWLVALWPLQVQRHSGARVVTDLSAPFGQYADIMIDAEALLDTGDLCRQMLGEARRTSRADALVLRKVRIDTPAGQVLQLAARRLDAPQQAPFVSMEGFAEFDAFHATAKSKTRKNVRNSTHRLEKLGAVSHRVERRSSRMDEALTNCFDLRSTWMERMGLTSMAFAHPAFADLVHGLADPANHDIDVLSMMLMLDDAPISIHYGFVHNRRYYAFMAARNPDYDACSPGKVHLEHVLRACHGFGIDTVDLLAPDMPYKSVWATGSIEIADFGVTWSVRGWLANEIWQRRLRPLSRAIFLALPTAVRQKMAKRHRAARP